MFVFVFLTKSLCCKDISSFLRDKKPVQSVIHVYHIGKAIPLEHNVYGILTKISIPYICSVFSMSNRNFPCANISDLQLFLLCKTDFRDACIVSKKIYWKISLQFDQILK